MQDAACGRRSGCAPPAASRTTCGCSTARRRDRLMQYPATMKRRTAAVAAVAFVAGLAIVRAQVTKSVPGDPIKTDGGLVAGTMSADGLKTYFGIPFAAPPVRENRWRAPQPVMPWQGVLTANKLPPECVQGLRSSTINHYFGDELSGEDCLYLNVWAPASATAGGRLPVVVWIY